jgi:hypothetical protein
MEANDFPSTLHFTPNVALFRFKALALASTAVRRSSSLTAGRNCRFDNKMLGRQLRAVLVYGIRIVPFNHETILFSFPGCAAGC